MFLIYFTNSCKKLEKDFTESKSNITKIEEKFNLIEKEENILKKEMQIDSLFLFVVNQDNTTKTRLYLSKILLNYYSIDKLDKLDKVSNILLKKSISSNDTANIGLSYRSRGYFFKNNKIYDSAFYYYLKAEKIYTKLSKTDYANVLLNKGMVQYKAGDNLGADLTLTRAYLIFKEANQNQKIFETLTTLGNVSEELRDYEKAIYYHYKALELTPAFEDDAEHKKSICLNNIGFVYLNMNKYDKSIKSFEDALKDKNLKKEMPDLYSNLIDNLAYVKLKNGNLNNILPYFNESLRLRDSLGYLPNIIMSKIHISKYYFLINDTLKSISFAKDALRLSSKNEAPANLLLSLRNITEVDLKNSPYYSKEYLRINDSLQLEERKSRDRFARIQLETDEVIQKNSELEVKNRNLVLFLFGTVIIFFLLYAVRTQKMRNRELAFKQEQQETNQQIYNMMISHQEKVDATSNYEKNRMAQELHDGVLSKMFGTRMNLDSLNEANDEATIAMRYNYIQELKSIEQEIREISHDLSSEKGKIILIVRFLS